MAISKWIGFGANPSAGSPNAATAADVAKAAQISSAEFKQFGLENVRAACLLALDHCY